MRRSARRLAGEARKGKVFQSIEVMTDLRLQKEHPTFYSSFTIFRDSLLDGGKVGLGRWAWKPFIVSEHLKRIPEGELLLYIDAGCHFNWNLSSTQRFLQYCSEAEKFGFLAMQLYPNEGGTGDLFEHNFNSVDNRERIEPSEEAWETCQIQATLMFLRNDETTRNFVDEWLGLASESNFMRLDESKIVRKDSTFKAYRWDQSIFSLLCKKYRLNYIFDETWWGEDWHTYGKNYPVWAMRHRSGAKPFTPKYRCIVDKALTRLNI